MKRTQKTPKEVEVQEQETKRKKRSLTKASSKKRQEKVIEATDLDQDDTDDSDGDTQARLSAPSSFRKLVFIVLVLAFLGWLGYKYSYFVIPARVNGKPIYVWEYVSTLNAQYGSEHLNTLTTQKIIEQAITEANVTIPSTEIDTEIDQIDKQASSSGGVKALLEAQSMSMEQLRDQVRIQLAVKQILKDKIAVTDTEVNDAYAKNKDFFKGKTEADAKKEIKEQLEAQKFQKEASAWVGEVRNKAKVDIALPGVK